MTIKKVPTDQKFYEDIIEILDEQKPVSYSDLTYIINQYYIDNYLDENESISYGELAVLTDFADKYIEEKNLILPFN